MRGEGWWKVSGQVPVQIYEAGFDGGGANVDANCDGLIRRNVGRVWGHNRCALYALYAILVSRHCGRISKRAAILCRTA